jgi:hypothetical protein
MAKIKVYNKNRFDVGVKLINPVREQNIKAGSFSVMEEDDIYYLDTTSALFRRGMLVVDDPDIILNMGYTEVNESIKSDEEIKEILKLSITKMKSELNKIQEPHLVNAVFNIAKIIGGELSGNKIKFLSEYCGRPILEDI